MGIGSVWRSVRARGSHGSGARGAPFLWAAVSALLLALMAVGQAGAHEDTAGQGGLEHPRHGLEEIGFHGLGDLGVTFGVDAWVGSDDRVWTAAAVGTACPEEEEYADGHIGHVKILELTDPTAPRVVAELPVEQGWDPWAVETHEVVTPGFTGHVLAVAGGPYCQISASTVAWYGDATGVDQLADHAVVSLYDVTDPAEPMHLADHPVEGFWTGVDLAFVDRRDLGQVHLLVDSGEAAPETGDEESVVQVVDVSRPATPETLSRWTLADAAGQGGPSLAELCQPRGRWHGCWANHFAVSPHEPLVYVAYHDAGVIALDLTDPTRPTFVGQVQPGGVEETRGNTWGIDLIHANGRELLVVADRGEFPTERFPRGFVRVVDVTDDDPATWRQVATVKAPFTDSEETPSGRFSSLEVHAGADGRVYVSWLTNGVRVLEPQQGSTDLATVAWFAPLASDHLDDAEVGPHSRTAPRDFGFWGTDPITHPGSGRTLVVNTDFHRGLYVLEYEDGFDAAPGRVIDRYAGASRYDTAVAISQAQFPDGAATVHLARAHAPLVDAVAGGSLTDGPTLLVPACGDIPTAITAEIDRLDPQQVIALGGPSAICDTTLAQAADGRTTGRYAGDSRYDTAVAISQAQFPDGAATVHLARAHAPLVDAVAGGSLTDGPTLLVPACGDIPTAITAEIDRLDPQHVIALGGPSAICDTTLAQAADGRTTGRYAGDSRYDTAVAISQAQFPDGAATVHLARAHAPLVDAVAGGSLTDGPTLLVPACGDIPTAITAEIDRLDPQQVIALGGPSAICDDALHAAARS